MLYELSKHLRDLICPFNCHRVRSAHFHLSDWGVILQRDSIVEPNLWDMMGVWCLTERKETSAEEQMSIEVIGGVERNRLRKYGHVEREENEN